MTSTAVRPVDRTYLEGLADRHLEAVLAHDPLRLPLHPQVRYVENCCDLAPGDGSWATITGLGHYRHYVADPATGQVGLVTTVREGTAGAVYCARLRVTGGLVTEIEVMIVRGQRSFDVYEELGEPHPIWLRAIPENERAGRAELAATANRYFAGLERNDGRIIPPFTDDCDRLEGGMLTTNVPHEGQYGHWKINDFCNRDARSQWALGLMQFVTEIRERRFDLIDEERGVVFACAVFDHDGTVNPVRLSDGRVLEAPPYFLTPRSLPVMEIFKVENGLIAQIEANLIESPYGMRQGWEATR